MTNKMQVLAGVLVGSVGFVTIMSIIPSFIRDLDNRVRSIYYEEIVSPYYKWIQSKDNISRSSPFVKSNIVKVLNRVTCHEERSYCEQEQINYIWKQCLKNGYTTSNPNQRVISSRDLKELVIGTTQTTITNSSTIESTDSNGIVYETEGNPKSVIIQNLTKGYCLGSEYITQ